MSSRFCFSEKEWPTAVKRALSDMIVNSGFGEISEIDFDLGPPNGGRLSFRFIVDGRSMPLCEPSDAYPFLESLREWMERCLVFDKRGVLHPEILTINCADGVYSAILFHAGWEEFEGVAEPVSGLIVIRSGLKRPVFQGFCRTTETIVQLYRRIIEGIRRYRLLFDRQGAWYDTGRFSLLDHRTTTERLISRIHSGVIEKTKRFYATRKY